MKSTQAAFKAANIAVYILNVKFLINKSLIPNFIR